MKKTLLFLLTLITITSQAQSDQKFNLGFEKQKSKKELPDAWHQWGTYTLSTEANSYEGQLATKITSTEGGSGFGAIVYIIPANYEGGSIQLEGYMKIKNVENGHAGLLLRIDGKGRNETLEFDNMRSQNISGTADWKKYTITLDYPKKAETIYVGGILVGKGELWLDDLVVTIDGKDVQTLKEVEQILPKADLDKEFDEASNIKLPKLNDELISNLELLARVWGFMKYHHPEIGKGNYNWDYELFRMLPKYVAVKNTAERDQLLSKWIEQFGKPEMCTTCQATSSDAFQKPDLSWIKHNNLEKNLENQLNYIYENRYQGEHYYIAAKPFVGNPKFTNEKSYADMPFPDDGYRLLTVFKYWNMIHYYFPYKHLMDKDWNKALKEYIPRFVQATSEYEYEIAAIQMIGDIQDTHANLWGGGDKVTERKGKFYPPVHVRFIEDKLVVMDYYNPEMKAKVGLEIGDVISEINGEKVENIIKLISKNYPASNEPTRLRNISSDLLRSNKEQIKITYLHNSKEQQKELQLYPRDSLEIYRWYRRSDEKCYKMLEDNIGYVTLQSIKDEDIPKIKEAFKNTKGIIIDIRNYPTTFVPFSLGGFFISSPTAFVKFTAANINNPGEFNFGDPQIIQNDKVSYKGKLIVMVNEISQSQAEYTSMAFRAGENTTIIGSTTAGADGNVSGINLPGGLRTMISGLGVFYPNGEETQRVGIVPDVEVKPTIEGIKNGRDELLEKAIELIKK